jgi:hypothetical protein
MPEEFDYDHFFGLSKAENADPVSEPLGEPETPVEPEPSPEPEVEPEPAPEPPVYIEPAPEPALYNEGDQLQMKDIDPHTVYRMSQLLRKRQNNEITQSQAHSLLIADEKLFWEMYNVRSWH